MNNEAQVGGESGVTPEVGPKCESCGQGADVKLADGATYCFACDESARNLGYDDEQGKPLVRVDAAELAALRLVARHSPYVVSGGLVGCAVCLDVWPCSDVTNARKALR